VKENKDDLGIYLKDHYAGGVGATELLQHLIKAHESEPLGIFFQGLLEDVSADLKTLHRLMTGLGLEESSVRNAGAWMAEKFARAKLGFGGGQDGLELLQALETLFIGITGKRLLWRALAKVDRADWVLHETDFNQLEKRALEQLDRVEAKRLALAGATFLRS
jgi:hypothetical protein